MNVENMKNAIEMLEKAYVIIIKESKHKRIAYPIHDIIVDLKTELENED